MCRLKVSLSCHTVHFIDLINSGNFTPTQSGVVNPYSVPGTSRPPPTQTNGGRREGSLLERVESGFRAGDRVGPNPRDLFITAT